MARGKGTQNCRVIGVPSGGGGDGIGGAGTDRAQRGRHAVAKEFEEAGQVGLGATEVIVVRRADGEGSILLGQVAGVVLVERVDPFEAVACAVQHKGGE